MSSASRLQPPSLTYSDESICCGFGGGAPRATSARCVTRVAHTRTLWLSPNVSSKCPNQNDREPSPVSGERVRNLSLAPTRPASRMIEYVEFSPWRSALARTPLLLPRRQGTGVDVRVRLWTGGLSLATPRSSGRRSSEARETREIRRGFAETDRNETSPSTLRSRVM